MQIDVEIAEKGSFRTNNSYTPAPGTPLFEAIQIDVAFIGKG
jgi:hypothetical protein